VTPSTKSALSPARRKLVELCQQIHFGRVEDLQVRDGEPILNPRPRVVVEHKFCSLNGPHPESARADSALKSQHVDLLRLLDEIGDGTIEVLTVKHGLPFHAELPG
jgi:hypothetical protein